MSKFQDFLSTVGTTAVITAAGVGFLVFTHGMPMFEKQIRSEYAYIKNIEPEIIVGAKMMQTSCEVNKICDTDTAKKIITRVANIKKIYSQVSKK